MQLHRETRGDKSLGDEDLRLDLLWVPSSIHRGHNDETGLHLPAWGPNSSRTQLGKPSKGSLYKGLDPTCMQKGCRATITVAGHEKLWSWTQAGVCLVLCSSLGVATRWQ